jgi:cytochrome P450
MAIDGALKSDLRSLLSSCPARARVASFIHRCHRLSKSYLLQRIRSGRLMPDQFGMTVDDLAMDVIADLFGRDEHGRFSQLANYFESIAWHEQSEEYLHAATRRLVMSQVTEGLF